MSYRSCMFRAVSPPIIRSLRLYIQHQVYVVQVLWLLASSIHGEMHSDWFNGIEILHGRWQHGEKVGYCYPSGLKRLCKWDIHVSLVTKGLTLSDPTSDLVRQFDLPVLLRCRKTSDTVFVAFVCPLSEPVRRFSSCSTDFSRQIAQVVLFLFLHIFLF
jgi:hypothetical protein